MTARVDTKRSVPTIEEEPDRRLSRTKSQVGFLKDKFEQLSEQSTQSTPYPLSAGNAHHRQVPLNKGEEEKAIHKKIKKVKGFTSSATLLPGLKHERRLIEFNPRVSSERGSLEFKVVIHSPEGSDDKSIISKSGKEEDIPIPSKKRKKKLKKKKKPFNEKKLVEKHFSLGKHSEAKKLFDKIDALEIISNRRKKKKFDAEFVKFLNEAWQKSDKHEISTSTLDDRFMEVCSFAVDEFSNNRDPKCTAQMLEIKTEEIAKELLLTAQHSGIILEPIYHNIFIIIDAFNKFMEEHFTISPLAKNLYSALQILIKKDYLLSDESTLAVKWGIPVTTFIENYRKITSDKACCKIVKFLQLPFSLKSKLNNEFLTFLTDFAFPTKDFKRDFFEKIHHMFRFNLQALNIPFIRHTCRGNEKMTTLINNISNYDALRGVMIGESVLMDQITINGNIFHNAESDGKPESLQYFYTAFLKALYHNTKLEKSISDETLDDHISIALTSIKSGLQGVTIKKKAPFFQVLKGCSNNSWSYAQDFMQLLYPGLFQDQFITNVTKGYSVCINIEGPNKFTLITNKNYAVYRKIDDRIGIDRSRPLATITFCWALEYNGEYWNGELQICDKIKFTDEATKQDRDLIHQSAINYTDIRRLPKDHPITPIISDHTEFSEHVLYDNM